MLSFMQEEQKSRFLAEAKDHLNSIREKITQSVQEKELKSASKSKEALKYSAGDALIERILVAHQQERIEQLKKLHPSPYFTRCDFEIGGEKKILYFGKFSFSEEGIYSWITPIATLRFENPGKATYSRPDGTSQSGTIGRKDQYMIVDGKLLFFSTEGIDQLRELIYQEHFTRHKEGFILPEVVEQMEKAQDQVIRAPHRGSFIISGPAGSGKTTLALHRVAYLIQSPETTEFFPLDSILVLVQDQGTKEYFSHLLPDLGIRGVSIVTFAEWAQAILKLEDHKYINNYGEFEDKRNLYEYAKLQALQSSSVSYSKNHYTSLQKVYANFLTQEQLTIFSWQKKEKLLDRFDLTVLLLCFQKQFGEFVVEKEYYEELKNGTYRKRKSSFPVQYNLMIIDEFQNYLPEQIKILHSCINHRLDSMVYVGDLAQQTQLGTIKSWESIGLQINQDRIVKLQKVYRNTKEILTYIKNLGYAIEVPTQVKSGKLVVEVGLDNFEKEIKYLEGYLHDHPESTVGILGKSREYLEKFKNHFKDKSQVYVLSFYEAQGVEFDTVFIVGGKEEIIIRSIPEELLVEIKRIEKDLLYVALTRAMSELYILGTLQT